MNKKRLRLLAFCLILVIAFSALAAVVLFYNQTSPTGTVRVACVGDSLTQSTAYPYDLWNQLGNQTYTLHNFGAGSTTVSLDSDTPYMNTAMFQEALKFQPDIVIIMLGTNDAQPSLHQFNASFVGDYIKLIAAFQELSTTPEIWVVLPPPIFSDNSGAISPQYYQDTIIPSIKQVANQTGLPLIDAYSPLLGHPEYFKADGIHLKTDGVAAEIIANQVYKAITPKT
jgi:lysophospholipase L1-like esterase